MYRIRKIIRIKEVLFDVVQRLNICGTILEKANPALKKSSSFYKFQLSYYNFSTSNKRQKEQSLPMYEEKIGEPIHLKKARLLYQSRKRGMLENGLILSAFASTFLNGMTEQQLELYDQLINIPTNDWEIYYWATGLNAAPPEFDNDILDMLKEFVKNKDRADRSQQPDL